MRQQKNILDKIYDYNKDDNSYKLEIKVSKYEDLFNSLDPAPLRKRDLDHDFVKYLEDFSDDIPLKYGIQLYIYFPHTQPENNNAERVSTAIKSYYNFMLLDSKKQIHAFQKESALFILVAIMLLFCAFYIGNTVKTNYFFKILIEGFNIGGWVFFWEALSILIFKIRKIIKKGKMYQRILDADVNFV